MKRVKRIHLCQSCDAELNSSRRYCDLRCQNIELCKSMGSTRYMHDHVAPSFQEMIRAEEAAKPPGPSPAIVKRDLLYVGRIPGEVVCVTCGLVGPWKGGKDRTQMQTGHFCSRKDRSVLFNEANVAVQCAACNQPPGSPNEFRQWMLAVRGPDVVEALECVARKSLTMIRDELVDMRVSFITRTKSAISSMKGS